MQGTILQDIFGETLLLYEHLYTQMISQKKRWKNLPNLFDCTDSFISFKKHNLLKTYQGGRSAFSG